MDYLEITHCVILKVIIGNVVFHLIVLLRHYSPIKLGGYYVKLGSKRKTDSRNHKRHSQKKGWRLRLDKWVRKSFIQLQR